MSVPILLICLTFATYLAIELRLWRLSWRYGKRQTALANLERLYAQIEALRAQTEAPRSWSGAGVRKGAPGPTPKAERLAPEKTWSPKVAAFYNQYVRPYTNVLEHNRFLAPVEKLLEILDQHGNCPSVVQDRQDPEFKALAGSNTYEVLGKVTLLDHSLNVTRELVRSIAHRRDYEMTIGKWLIIGLAHDIGKIPAFRRDDYARGDHPILSRSMLRGIVGDLPGHDDILDAVRDHHFPNAEAESTVLLRKADFAAREAELRSVSPSADTDLHKVAQEEHQASRPPSTGQHANRPNLVDLSWMDGRKFLSRLEARINILDNNHFQAFSTRDGMVYVYMKAISDTVMALAEEQQRISIFGQNRRDIEYSIRNMLDEHIPDYIGKNFPGARFQLLDNNGKVIQTGFYMPVKAEAFSLSITEMERRKKGKLLKIAQVQPLVGKKI